MGSGSIIWQSLNNNRNCRQIVFSAAAAAARSIIAMPFQSIFQSTNSDDARVPVLLLISITVAAIAIAVLAVVLVVARVTITLAF